MTACDMTDQRDVGKTCKREDAQQEHPKTPTGPLDTAANILNEIADLGDLSTAEVAWIVGTELNRMGEQCQFRVISFDRPSSLPRSSTMVCTEINRLYWKGYWWGPQGAYFDNIGDLLDDSIGVGEWCNQEWNNFPFGDPSPLGLARVSIQQASNAEHIPSLIEAMLLTFSDPSILTSSSARTRRL